MDILEACAGIVLLHTISYSAILCERHFRKLPKRLSSSTRQHGVTIQKTEFFRDVTVRTLTAYGTGIDTTLYAELSAFRISPGQENYPFSKSI